MGSLSYRVPLFKLTNGLNKSLLLSLVSRARSVGARVGVPIKFDSSKKAFIEEQLASQTLSQQSPPQELEDFEEKEKRDV